ncbi:hypothetical protein L204_103393 [Cryptococcus depauperatus]
MSFQLPTLPPGQLHTHSKRHYYVCAGQTLSWEPNWYTEPFFTSEQTSYDRAASTGPVNPPASIFESADECARILKSLSGMGNTVSSTVAKTDSPNSSRSKLIPITTTLDSVSTSNGGVATKSYSSVMTLGTSTVTAVSMSNSGSTDMSSLEASGTTTIISTSKVTTTSSVGPTSILAFESINSCAGEWDWQDWGAISGLGLGVILGGILWILWALLRPRIPSVFSPRSYFVPPSSRPSSWSWLIFLFPFLHLPPLNSPETPPSEGDNVLHLLFLALKLAAIGSLVSLGAILIMILAGVPCVRETAPLNSLGGRLGSLTDMSLLRLLDALDPSPDSASTHNYLMRMAASLDRRNLPSTIAPAIGSARTRLIIILVLLTVFWVGGGLFVIIRLYSQLAKSKKIFEEKTCQSLDMIFIHASKAQGWLGVSEEGLKRWLNDWWKTSFKERLQEDEVAEIEISGLFAIPNTSELRNKVQERERVLMALELAETQYVQSFKSADGRIKPSWQAEDNYPPKHTGTEKEELPSDFLAPKGFYKVNPVEDVHSDRQLNRPSAITTTDTGTRFHEVNQSSVLLTNKFEIGQRVKIDDNGDYVLDPSPPTSSESNMLDSDSNVNSALKENTFPGTHIDASLSRSLSKTVPERTEEASLTAMTKSPQAATSRELSSSRAAHGLSQKKESRATSDLEPPSPSHRHSETPSLIAKHCMNVREHHTSLKTLNTDINLLQRQKFEYVVGDGQKEGINGWILIGRGVKWMPGSILIEARTREDILWHNLNKKHSRRSEIAFWVEVVLVGIVLAMICIPFIGLSVGTAPGFSHYLSFLKPLAKSDGFGSGVVEGLVPAITLTISTTLAVYGIERLSKRVHSTCRTHQKLLAYKATFWLLLSVMVIWIILIIALQYAVQNFALNVQKARGTGDGAVFSAWPVFVLLLNLAFVAPGLYLLQGKRLLRCFKERRKAITPRQKFRMSKPPSFNPSYAMLSALLAVFYASTLMFLFPLLAIPIMVLLYLIFIASRYMISHVFLDSAGGHIGTLAALWTVRRLGWVLSLGPVLYGLILLSRNEWALGGISLGVAGATVILSEILVISQYLPSQRKRLAPNTHRALDKVKAFQKGKESSQVATLPSRPSELSLLRRVTALLPGYSRLPQNCPLPLRTESIDDMFQTERAAYTKLQLVESNIEAPERLLYENSDTKGLIYPPEMLAPSPIIWLPADEAGIAENEVEDLMLHHGLIGIVDPIGYDKLSNKKKREGKSRRADSPLLSGS